MKQSRRMKRMEEHHKRRTDRTASLNMVSLMDIFTILVFFLLVSAADTEVLPSSKAIKLPESTAEKTPKETLVILVNNQDIILRGERISGIKTVMRDKNNIIKPLMLRLKELQADKKIKQAKRRSITIMGDREIPYRLLKKIMLTCANADYTNISLAVVQKVAEQE